ncbi:tatD related DNase [Wolffia australiana]
MNGTGIRLFDAHCHLQDPRILSFAPEVIRKAQEAGIVRFAVNGVSERDWNSVKQMAEQHTSVIPCFGLHPWYVQERSTSWLSSMREFFKAVPYAAVGEIGLDKGSHGRKIEFMEQVEVFIQQLKLAKDLERPASVHCVRAYGDLLEILQSEGPFPAGLILHSYLGSAEMVSAFTKHGAYFSFSGFLTSMKPQKAKKMLKMVPLDRLLLESDAPDGFPCLEGCSSFCAPGEESITQEPTGKLNHPANIPSILSYVAMLLEMPEEELAQASYRNAMRIFSYPGSKFSEEVLPL